MVLLQQMQEEFIELRERRAQAKMDRVLRQGRKRKSLKPQAVVRSFSYNQSFFVALCMETRLYLIWICIAPRKNCFINTSDIPVRENR